MQKGLLKIVVRSGLALFILVGWSATARAQWTTLTNAPGAFLDTCLLLTDGTVMCHVYNSNGWRRLTPDLNGNYANGTWSNLPSMPNGTDTTAACNVVGGCPYRPLYFASAVLADGRVVVIGGEYNNLSATWTNIGFLYNPFTNAWSTQLTEAFGTGNVGDVQSTVLADGRMLLARISDGNIESFNPATLTFTALNPTGKLAGDRNNEEGWNILPDGRVFTVNAFVASSFELYDPVTNTWGNSGPTPVNLADCCGAANGVGNSKEVGPGVLRPDGGLIYFSGNSLGQNAVYNTSTGTWSHTAAMDFPLVTGQTYHYAVADGPASLLPNGNVLVMASPVRNGAPFNAPSHFFEFNGTTLTQVADSPNAASFIAYQGRMVLLPSGQVLLSAYNQVATQDVLLYSNGGAPQNAWRPVITTAPSQVVAGNTYSISGTLFNGFSEGASYGDDAQSSTNYPLVRIRNQATGHVFYARTHNHSRMGVEAVGSPLVVTTQFDVPLGLEPGVSDLVVVVNGIPSLPTTINQPLPTTLSYTGDTLIPNGGTATMRAVLREAASSLPIVGRTVLFTLGTGGSAQTCSGVTNASGTATCSISPVAQPLGSGVVAASFAGDASYSASSTSASTLIFELLQNGSFVVGDLSESVGASVTFWGAQWGVANDLSGEGSPSFKGYANSLSVSPPACGITWTSRGGAGSQPPATVPSYMGVLVSSAIDKSGSTVSGNTVRIAVIQTNPGYGPAPGQTGTGTVVAELCH